MLLPRRFPDGPCAHLSIRAGAVFACSHILQNATVTQPLRRHIVMAWFRSEDWEEIKALCPRGDLQDTYHHWYENVQGGLKGLGVTEDEVEKSILTPDDLRNWQASNVGPINSLVRMRLDAALAIRSSAFNPILGPRRIEEG
jgi:hypothetical protein